MALAHAHCAMHDLFACDARLAPDSAYYKILASFVGALTDWPAVVARWVLVVRLMLGQVIRILRFVTYWDCLKWLGKDLLWD